MEDGIATSGVGRRMARRTVSRCITLSLCLGVGWNNTDCALDPATDDPPRGFLVHASLDLVPEDIPAEHFSGLEEDERDRISTLLWGGVLVQG